MIIPSVGGPACAENWPDFAVGAHIEEQMFAGVAPRGHERQSNCQYRVGSFAALARQEALTGKEEGRRQPTEMSESWVMETLAGLLDKGGVATGFDSPQD